VSALWPKQAMAKEAKKIKKKVVKKQYRNDKY